MSTKNSKRILEVKIKHMVDESPDTSWLGEYSDQADTEFAIDRDHSLDCIANTPTTYPAHTIYECGICGSCHRWEFDGDCREDSERFGTSEDYAKQYNMQDQNVTVMSWQDRQDADNGCTCGEHGDKERGQHRYFNPGSVEPFKADATWIPADVTDKQAHWRNAMRSNAKQDYERMQAYGHDQFTFIGIKAVASIAVPTAPGNATVQQISSGGLWGIESDSGNTYLNEVEHDELNELKTQLVELGFSKRAIATAFKSVHTEAI